MRKAIPEILLVLFVVFSFGTPLAQGGETNTNKTALLKIDGIT